jgi:hypothetical protein
VLHARGQFDRATTALDIQRNYYTASLNATLKASAWMAIDAGVTFRLGDLNDPSLATEFEYDNLIFHFGLAATY